MKKSNKLFSGVIAIYLLLPVIIVTTINLTAEDSTPEKNLESFLEHVNANNSNNPNAKISLTIDIDNDENEELQNDTCTADTCIVSSIKNK